MNLCSDGHEEVVHEFRGCPVCTLRDSLKEETAELSERLEALRDRAEGAESECEQLRSTVNDLNQEISEQRGQIEAFARPTTE